MIFRGVMYGMSDSHLVTTMEFSVIICYNTVIQFHLVHRSWLKYPLTGKWEEIFKALLEVGKIPYFSHYITLQGGTVV